MGEPQESFKCYLVSWEEAYRLAKILADKIKKSGFKPDLIIGIARGGLIPARTVSDFLLQKDLASIQVEHWGIARTIGKAKIKYPLQINVSGKKVLLVDDVADTGDTYSVTMQYLAGLNPSEVRTAVLHYKTSSTFAPDYWSEKMDSWKWIVYPWALYEDVAGFVERLLSQPMTCEEIRKSLGKRFDIKISKKELDEILNDMEIFRKLKKCLPTGKKIKIKRGKHECQSPCFYIRESPGRILPPEYKAQGA